MAGQLIAALETVTIATNVIVILNQENARIAPDAIRTVMTALQKKYTTAASVTDIQ